MTKDERWGSNRATFQFLGELISPPIEKAHFVPLRKVSGHLHTKTIDELVSDLIYVKQTIETRAYADDRPVVYLHPDKRTFHSYLALATGRALSAQEAWAIFHGSVLSTTALFEEMEANEDMTDHDYYRRRYTTVWDEIYEVYRMFALLVGLECPPLNR